MDKISIYVGLELVFGPILKNSAKRRNIPFPYCINEYIIRQVKKL